MITKDLELGAIQIMSPSHKSKHHDSQFQIMGGIVLLVNLQLPRSICH